MIIYHFLCIYIFQWRDERGKFIESTRREITRLSTRVGFTRKPGESSNVAERFDIRHICDMIVTAIADDRWTCPTLQLHLDKAVLSTMKAFSDEEMGEVENTRVHQRLHHPITRQDGLVFCTWNNSILAIIHPSLPPFLLPLPPLPLSFVSFSSPNPRPSLPIRIFVSIFPASCKNCNCITDAPRRAGTLAPRVPWSRANRQLFPYIFSLIPVWNLASRVSDIQRFTPRTWVIWTDAFTCGIFAVNRRYFDIGGKNISIFFQIYWRSWFDKIVS